MEKVIGTAVGTSEHCQTSDNSSASTVCVLNHIIEAIVSLATAFDEERTVNHRAVNTVYVTAHPLVSYDWLSTGSFGTNWIAHTALEFRASGAPVSETQTISAGPDPEDAYETAAGSSVLKSGENRPSDKWWRNYAVGTVVGPTPPLVDQAQYWESLRLANSFYPDCLNYQISPDAMLGEGYNSNGFVAGIVSATTGVSDVDFGAFVGGLHAVPAVYFHPDPPLCN